ncbi:MAG: tetratricopeptide repeat protein [Pseudomonadota bacterium]
MDELLSEKEQLEAIRSWWSENGTFVVAGLVIGIASLGGWRYWQSYTETRAEAASAVFEQLTDAVQGGDRSSATALADDLDATYGATPYADQAQLLLARLYVDQDEPALAIDALEKVASGADDAGLANVASLRIARLLLDQGKVDEALARLPAKPPAGFAARYQDVRGDALVASGDLAGARAAYAAALLDYPPDAATERAFVELKLSKLGGAEAQTAAVSADE